MIIRALASGSNGNSFVIAADDGIIIVDAGISRKRILAGLRELEIPLDLETHVLITHEHIDHSYGLAVLSSHMEFTAVGSMGTLEAIADLQKRDLRYESALSNALAVEAGFVQDLGAFEIIAYETDHDAAGPFGYLIIHKNSGLSISFATDTDDISEAFRKEMNQSDIIMLESNHDLQMLRTSRRPPYLIKRIEQSHLNNNEAMMILDDVINDRTKLIMLGHLSGECNTPAIVASKIDRLRKHRLKKNKDEWDWVICERTESSAIVYVDEKSKTIEAITGGLSSLNYQQKLASKEIKSEPLVNDTNKKINLAEYAKRKGIKFR